MNLPDLRQLRYFIAVAERLHFGRAAAALHISQPPLSRAIQSLEERLGVALFARTRRRVELTAEGARFLDEARRLAAQLETAVTELQGMAAGERGRLRIGFVSLADYGVLPSLLKAYKAARPGVALALREMLSPEQAAALAAGDLDFGLLLPPVSGAAGLEHLTGLKKLRQLQIGGSAVTDAGLARLKALPDLELLNLAYTAIGKAGGRALLESPHLPRSLVLNVQGPGTPRKLKEQFLDRFDEVLT